MPFSPGTKNSFSRYEANSAYVCDEPAMTAAAFAYVDRANGRYRYRPLRCETQYPAARRCLSNCGNPFGQGKPPLIGPMTKGIGPLRRKNANGLGSTGTIGKMRSTTSNSPDSMRFRISCHARHSNAT